jgi:tetratricopeptide (TPR) repeat protein
MKAHLRGQVGKRRLQLLCSATAVCFHCSASADETNWPSVRKSDPDLYVCASIIPHLGVPDKFPPEAVISSCSKLISIVEQKHKDDDQRSVNFYYGRAIAYIDAKQWAGALHDLDKALRLFPNDEEFLEARRTASKQLGDAQEANTSRQTTAVTGATPYLPPPAAMTLPALSEINRGLQELDQRDQADPYAIGAKARYLQQRGELYLREGYYRYALEDLKWAQQAWKRYGDKSARAQSVETEIESGIREAEASLPQDRKSYNIAGADFVTFICEPAGDRISIDKINLVVLDDVPIMGSRCVTAYREDVDGGVIFNEDQCQAPFASFTQATMPAHKTVSLHGSVVFWSLRVMGPFALKAAAAGPLNESLDLSSGVHTGTQSRRQCHVLRHGE